MALKLFITLLFHCFLHLTSAHFHLNYPYWRGDSFAEGKSQWIMPCANVSETTNRTSWSPTGGSLILSVSHPYALTYVNLGLGNNVSSFNISLVENFNQTGNGTFCLKSVGKDALAEGLRDAGLDARSAEGVNGSLQVVQISHTGASLYNCADITFNATAALLGDDMCLNSTGVGGVAIMNADASMSMGGSPSATGSASATASSTGAAVALAPRLGGVLAVAAGMAYGMT